MRKLLLILSISLIALIPMLPFDSYRVSAISGPEGGETTYKKACTPMNKNADKTKQMQQADCDREYELDESGDSSRIQKQEDETIESEKKARERFFWDRVNIR